MADRPILFSTPMVKAILSGHKSMTRRVVKSQPEVITGDFLDPYKWYAANKGEFCGDITRPVKCPYGTPGTRLWVKETWRRADENCPDGIYYKANNMLVYFDGNEPEIARSEIKKYPRNGKNKPSIFMPRWASRITLEITNVRVERLQEITPRDAWREGVQCKCMSPVPMCKGNIDSFQDLWDSINGKTYPWASNPWVWCISFKRVPDEIVKEQV